MASRLAKKKLNEDEVGVVKRRRVTAPEPVMTEQERVISEKRARMEQRTRSVVVPQTQPDVETAPVPPPPTINTTQDMSNTLKEILQPKQEVKEDTITPEIKTVQNDQNVRYDPATDRTEIVTSTPSENLKTIEKVIQSIPSVQQVSAVPLASSRASIESKFPKRSFESPQQYSERIDSVIAQQERLASKGITEGERASAIVKQAQGITEQRAKEQQAQKTVEETYFNDPWVQERLAMKEARARSDAIFNPIVQGLTDTMDVLVHALPVLGGSAGGVLAQAYKNFAPPTSQFYQDKSFGDKTVDFLTENVKDKVKDLGTGIAVSQLKNGVNLVKGYRPIALTNKSAVKNFGIGSPSVNNPVAPLREGSQFYVPKTAPATPTTPITSLPARSVQAPQRLQAQRTDVLISPRSNVARR